MKKFRLIREYPGSPKLGTIVMNGIIGVNKNNSNLLFDGSRRLRDIELPHKYPEFWEEVVEKDYEILSLIGGSNERILKDSGNIKAWLNGHKGGWRIHSVKRLSDGEIFTIGDNTTYGNIKSFNLISYSKHITVHFNNTDSENCICEIKKIKKIKKPLFTTEDGVDIYKNSESWWVAVNEDTKISTQDKKWEYDRYDWNKPGNPSSSKNYKWFSTEEKAKEYIIMNKPCLSINDVLKTSCYNQDQLKELVKSKL